MNKKRILSLLLCLATLCALLVPASSAADDTGKTKGIELTKTAKYNEKDGTYTITLEAYATGEKTTTTITEEVPTDIILVLDQSGSMAEAIGGYSYTAYTNRGSYGSSRNYYNSEYYPLRHNEGSENLWYQLKQDEYVSVSVENSEVYTQISGWSNHDYHSNQSNLYCYISGEPQKVNVSWNYESGIVYTYTVGGQEIAKSTGYSTTPDFGSYAPLYQYGTKYIYSYTIGETKTIIEESVGDDKSPNTQFYRKGSYSQSAGGTRLDALKGAALSFASAVNTKAKGKDGQYGGNDDINHRIAIVGFSSPNEQSRSYNNTELLTGSTITQGTYHQNNHSADDYDGYYYFPTYYEMNGPQYGNISDTQYKDALLAMDKASGLTGVTAGVNALTAWGGTRIDLGIEMANNIFAQNPIGQNEKRNRVVIVFTDGIPGQSGYDPTVDSNAIAQAKVTKETYGATVYTIGVFPGADASKVGSVGNGSSDADKGNNFLQRLSSNEKYPQSPSYYLSAGDAESLNNIFQQISSQLPTGGSSTTLDSDAVIKDIISPQFTLPEGADESSITLKTFKYYGSSLTDPNAWHENSDAMGATAELGADNSVSVTGFNFSENWCGTETKDGTTTYRGNKLVISFDVTPKTGFLGGNDVETNAGAGIYESADAKEPLKEVDSPTVNVPIEDVTVTAQDKNVYLLGSVTADQLKEGATVKVGNVPLDLSKDNYGLEAWQTEYVTIDVKVKDKDGNYITGNLDNLTDDTTYTVEVTVTPKTTPPESTQGETAVAKKNEGDDNGKGNIYVFTPTLNYKDSEVYYGETASTFTNGNLVSTTWKHGNKTSTDEDVTMIGTKPELNVSYTSTITPNQPVNTKTDAEVDVTDVKIGDTSVKNKVSFEHTACNPTCSWEEPTTPGDPAFLIHVKTCQLTITKIGGAENESYVFTVMKDGVKYTEASIYGPGSVDIVELPVGTYTIEEDTGWSWRYPNPTYTSNNAELKAGQDSATITCSNTQAKDKWLNGFSTIVQNIFNRSGQYTKN